MSISEQTKQLTNHLHRGGQWVHFFTFEGGQTNNACRSEWRPVGKDFRPPAAWMNGKNIFFTVNPVNKRRGEHKGSRNEDISAVNALYAEFDAIDFVNKAEWLPFYVEPNLTGLPAARAKGALHKAQTEAKEKACRADLEQYKKLAWSHVCSLAQQPSVVWDSGGGYQALWLLEETVFINAANRMMVAHVQQEWVKFVGGDTGASDLRCVLRFPGSFNRKSRYAPDYPLVAYKWINLEIQYRFAELAAIVPPQEQPTPRTKQTLYVPPGIAQDLATCGDVPNLPKGHALIDDYNKATDLRSLLLEAGYTDHGSQRMSRPGGTTGGVKLNNDNSAWIFSSADPLFCDGRHPITPAHVIYIFECNGDVNKLLAKLEAAAGAGSVIFKLREIRQWVQGSDLILQLREGGIKRPDLYAKTLIAIIDYAIQRGAPRVLLSYRQLGELANTSHMSAKRHLEMLGSTGLPSKKDLSAPQKRDGLALLSVDPEPNGFGQCIDLCNLLQSVTKRYSNQSECNTSQQFLSEFIKDDAYTSYPHRFAAPLRPDVKLLPYGLSPAALFIVSRLLQHQALTRADISRLTGLSRSTVRSTLKRMECHNLVLLAPGRTSRYDLHPDYEVRLDELKSQFPSYGISLLRAARNADARATFAHRQLLMRQDLEPQARAKLEKYKAKYELLAQNHFSTLEAIGISPDIHGTHRLPQGHTSGIQQPEEAAVIAEHRNNFNKMNLYVRRYQIL